MPDEQHGFPIGRFPRDDAISFVDPPASLNLSESTTPDLTFGDIVDLLGDDTLRGLRLGYAPPAGIVELRRAVAETVGVPEGWVLATHGVALGLALLAFGLLRPGDEVVLATPCFPPARDTLHASGAVVRDVALRFDTGYALDLDRVAAELSPATRLVSLASPQNPSGVRISHADLAALLTLMAERASDAILFVDETYREATYGTAPVPPSAACLDPRVVTAGSVSKAYGVPGLRVGWLTCGDPGLHQRLTVAKVNLVVSGSPLDEAIAARLLTLRDGLLPPRRAALGAALETVASWQAGERHRLDWVRPDAGALCCLRLRERVFDAEAVPRFWDALRAQDVELGRGVWFGESARTMRLGFGHPAPADLTAGLAAVSRAMSGAA